MKSTETIGCEEALRQLLFYLDDELPEPNRAQVHEHLERCRSCWSRSEFERRLKAKVAEVGKATVPPELETRIRELLAGGSRETGG